MRVQLKLSNTQKGVLKQVTGDLFEDAFFY